MSPLSKVLSIKQLLLGANMIVDVSQLATLKALEELFVSDN